VNSRRICPLDHSFNWTCTPIGSRSLPVASWQQNFGLIIGLCAVVFAAIGAVSWSMLTSNYVRGWEYVAGVILLILAVFLWFNNLRGAYRAEKKERVKKRLLSLGLGETEADAWIQNEPNYSSDTILHGKTDRRGLDTVSVFDLLNLWDARLLRFRFRKNRNGSRQLTATKT
jgi:hypothetical protein